MNISNLRNIYFLGIGGIGMSGLARYFNLLGMNVSGYDKTSTNLTSSLIEEGIKVHFDDDISKIPKEIDLVVYTPAIPDDLQEYIYLQKMDVLVLKRAVVLGLIAREKKAIAIAGTHGKTTVSTMIAHLMRNSDLGCNAFLGGIAKNYNSNLLFDKSTNHLVAEADEYDQSFLSLYPDMAVVTSTDADHLDIYGEKKKLLYSFQQFVNQINQGGTLVMKKELELVAGSDVSSYTYSLNGPSDFYATDVQLINGNYKFSLVTPTGSIQNLKLNIPGLINLENAIAALAVGQLAGISEDKLRSGIESFMGIKRRFDIRFKSDDIIYIDDYAHHPEEIKAFINSVKKLYPDKKHLGVFQPHLFSRTRDFAIEFAQSLELLDEVILLPIYPAREKPIEGISSGIILEMINLNKKELCGKEKLLEELKHRDFEILLTMGAGDIDQLVEPICDMLELKLKTILS